MQIINLLNQYRQNREVNRTVLYVLLAALGAALVVGILTLSSADNDSYVFLKTPVQAVEVGDLFPVVVYVSAAVPINGIELQVSFPADKVDVFGVDRGQSVLSVWPEDPVITSDTIQLRGRSFKRGFSGDHQIAIINFRAKEAGQYAIKANELRLVAGDGQGTEVPIRAVTSNQLTVLNFDQATSESDIRVAISQGLQTDLTADGKITLQDISVFVGAWSDQSNTHDFNNDGMVSFKDFSIILADSLLH